VIDWPALVAAFGHRPNLTDKLITATLESSAEVPEAIRTAIEQCDLSRIGFIAHSLKGLGANLKARRVNELALQAEAAATAGRESEATELAAKLAEATDELLKALKSRAATANARPA
jgi:HPt (histidine-containing phosphotransfer) domain-containing protein